MSNFWVICVLALLCLGSVKCSRYFPEEDEYFLDKTKDSEERHTEKEEDTEWDAGKVLSEINDIWKLYKLQHNDPAVPEGKDPNKPEKDDKTTGGGEETVPEEKDPNKPKEDDQTTGGDEEIVPDGDDSEQPNKDGDEEIDPNGDEPEQPNEGGDEEIPCKEDKDCSGPNRICSDKKFCQCQEGFGGEDCTEILGCRILEENCKKVQAECVFDEDAPEKATCKCKDNLAYDRTNNKCILTDKICKEKKVNCMETGGSCSVDQGIQCNCPASIVYAEETGCNVTQEKCKAEKKNCIETGGSCLVNKNIQCVCPANIEHVEDTGCNVTQEKCKAEKKNCIETGGSCSIGNNKNIQCVCPASIEYAEVTGCNVTQAKCEEAKPNCTKTGGSCSIDKDKNFQCVCPINTGYGGNRGCIGDQCVEKCGIRQDEQNEKLKCEGDPFGDVKCSCILKDDKNIDFDPRDKKCKTDYCKAKCGKLNCGNGDRFDESKFECICPNPAYEEFDKTKNECKTNYCKKICGPDERVECEDKYNKEMNLTDCKCKEEDEYVFIGKKCRKTCDDDCENGGKCETKGDYSLCNCTKGTTGDMCEIIEDCSRKFKNCTGDKGDCKFVNGTAKCICPKGKVINQNVNYCQDDNCIKTCGISHDKEDNQLKCIGRPYGDVKCNCQDKDNKYLDFDPKDKKCKTNYCNEKCTSRNLKCEGDPFDQEKAKCKCPNKFQEFDEEEKICKLNYCKKVCGPDERVTCDNKYNKEMKLTDCKCNDEDEYVFIEKKCREKCNNDCQNNGTCENKGEYSLCKCHKGTTGDKCEIIEDCNGKYKNCKGDKGECKFESGEAKCICPEGKTVIQSLDYCEVPCKEDKECSGPNRMCKEKKYCQCKEGFGGEDCTEILGCKKLKEKCTQAEAECVFDKDAPEKATCKCKDNFAYDPTNNKCIHSFCYPNSPCENCTHDESTGIGYCVCPEDKYFDYKAKKCAELPDKCILKKTPCGENQICRNGKCMCGDKEVKEGEECKPKFCESCFKDADCSEEGGSCYCGGKKYFKTSACQTAKCVLNDFKKNCTCPKDTTRKDNGECEAPEEKKCTKDCGYGVCVKNNEKAEICNCFKDVATKTNGTCVLKTMYCEGGKLQEEDPMKCKCEGQYKLAADDITCIPKTCKDEDVKKECAEKGAICVPKAKQVGYDCECPAGYVPDKNGKCSEPCSVETENSMPCAEEGQLCFNSLSGKNGYICTCPPTFKKDSKGKCSEKAEYGYLFNNIFVQKKRYEFNGKINTALLNEHIKQSLEQSFSDFESGYVYDFRISGDALNCSVWINFNEAPKKTDLDKIKLLSKKFVCDGCDENAIFWPPNILLSSEGLKNAEYSHLEFCSDVVKDVFCGKETKCAENKCSCKDGFTIIRNSIQNIGDNKVVRCEDVDECASGNHACSENTDCVNTYGSYKCVCKDGYKKKETPTNPETDKSPCYDMCSPSPCKKGKCVLKEKTFDCECDAGYGGTFCDRADQNYASAKKGTVVVGAVLGTILILGTIAVLYFVIMRIKKRSGSEDFMPAPRMDRAEMTERRPVRGVTNRAYE